MGGKASQKSYVPSYNQLNNLFLFQGCSFYTSQAGKNACQVLFYGQRAYGSKRSGSNHGLWTY
jgi:hypothetical protein